MDKSILVEYADVKEELKDLRRRIEEDQRELQKLDRMVVTDSVTCGKKGKKPLRTVKIQGRPLTRINRKQAVLERRLARREALEAKLLEKQTEAEEYIESIPQSELRMMFRFYYIDDLRWYQVALRMNEAFPDRRIKYTEDNCKQRHKRFFDKVG